MNRPARTTSLALVLGLIALAFFAAPARATVLEPGFTESLWITGPSNTTGMAWAPDGSGRLFVIAEGGTVRIVQYGTPPTSLPTPFATISPIFTSQRVRTHRHGLRPGLRVEPATSTSS